MTTEAHRGLSKILIFFLWHHESDKQKYNLIINSFIWQTIVTHTKALKSLYNLHGLEALNPLTISRTMHPCKFLLTRTVPLRWVLREFYYSICKSMYLLYRRFVVKIYFRFLLITPRIDWLRYLKWREFGCEKKMIRKEWKRMPREGEAKMSVDLLQ